MSTAQITKLLANLGHLGIRLWVEGEHLRFKAPQGVLTPELKADLLAQKPALLEILRAPSAATASIGEAILPRDRAGDAPLSFAQERLWLLDQFQPGNANYNIFDAIRIEGDLNVSALEQTLRHIALRHEILRSVFITRGARPWQSLLPNTALQLLMADLNSLSEDLKETECEHLFKQEINRPFDLGQGPLWRVLLFRFSRSLHVLVLNLHHIIYDGGSRDVLLSELQEIYQSFSAGMASALPPLSIQYADFACWQREWMKDGRLDRELSFWKQQLAGAPQSLQLPVDRPRPEKRSLRSSVHVFHLSSGLTGRALDLCRQENVTLSMLLLSAWSLLLSRYSGQQDLVIGTPAPGRIRPVLGPLIGLFVNTLALRFQLSGEWAFFQHLQRVRETVLVAQDHQELPFEKLIEEIQPGRDASYAPIFQVMFAFQDAPEPEIKMPGLVLKRIPLQRRTTAFDLLLGLRQSKEGVDAELEYDVELFDASTIGRMAAHFTSLLASAVQHPHLRISELDMLSEAESRQLLVEWNRCETQLPQSCLQQLFEQQAESQAEATAVDYEGQSLSYGELNRRANQVAHYLRRLGVGQEALVGMCVERSLEMVVGILGILKAGAGYVPLDSAYPAERLEYMTKDAGVGVVLAQGGMESKLGNTGDQGIKVVRLDKDWELLAGEGQENLEVETRIESVAYVIYTSGSTGKPKGVVVSHGNVVRLFAATQRWFEFGEEDVWTMFHSYAFDFSVWELWGALLYGGRLIVVPYWVGRSPEAMYELVRQEKVTVLNQTPSAFGQLSQAEEARGGGEDLSLRLVIFGGEALEMGIVRPWLERHGDERPQLINMYGITETTVHVTYQRVTREVAAASASVIGVKIPDLQLYVLQQGMMPAGIAVVGELYVGGAGVARGYLGRPDLTAERFVPHACSETGGERLYRSGDLGRYREDGTVEYLGRMDQQVKIRGHRIELGEVEAALLRHREVRQAAVVVREDQPGEKRLVGYVVYGSGEKKPGAGGLRNHLRERLPEYMVPAAFVEMDKLPLTTNGKLDRKALPRPELRAEEKKYVAPRNKAEEMLCGIWERILGVERVGIEDNFFELGGDSILSIQIVTEGKNAGLNFSLRHMFKHQTIAELVQVMDGGAEREAAAVEVAEFGLISEEERLRLPQDMEDAFPLSRLQAGMFFHSQYNPEAILYHNVATYQLQMPLDLEVLQRAVEELVQRHPVLRTSFHLNDYSQPLQLVHRTAQVDVQTADISGLGDQKQEDEIRNWREEEKERFFDPQKPGLLRFYVHRRAQDRFAFSMSEHHAILDGWSVASLLTELFTCYLARLEGKQWQPERLASSFRNFVALEQAELRSAEARRYWEQQLQDVNVPRMPWTGGVAAGAGRARVQVVLGKELSLGLRKLAQQLGVSLKTVLLAGHMRVMHLLSSREGSVITGLVSNGRPETRDGERVLGLFLNTLPLRMRLHGGRWRDLVEETAVAERALLRHRRYPLVELHVLTGNASLFDVIFNFTHFHVYRQLQQSGLKLLSAVEFERTNFALVVDAGINALSSDVHLILDYDRSLIQAGQLEAIEHYYRNTLRALVEAPEERYETTRLLREEEERQLLVEWNRTQAEYPKRCVHELFEEQVERTPENVALVYEGRELSYFELNQRANQLGHYLRSMGVGPEVLVGICMERSLEMVIGILGVLKAGGAYLPLDPEYPAERLEYMVLDAGMQVLVIGKGLEAKVPRLAAVEVQLEEAWAMVATESGDNPDSGTTAGNLVYVMYTSGSTGKPKGIAVPHQGVVRLVKGNNFAELGEKEVMLQMAPVSFDASTLELWGSLLNGGKLVVMKAGTPALEEVGRVLRQQGVTTAWLTAGLFHAMVEEQVESLQGVRQVLAGGDVLSPAHVARFFEGGGKSKLINGYGPTENTTFTCCHGMEEYRVDGKTIAIGRPIANTQVYVLDEWMHLVPAGVVGELYIGGDGLARGYVGRADLTAAKFVPHPLSVVGGERLYRSGDLCRWREGGEVEFVGRKDQQVKIRGYRIELAEIEGLLGDHPEVGQVVVVAQEEAGGGKRLVAYVVGKNGRKIEGSELGGYLRSRLPEYMVPAVFVEMDELPLTSNGKVDRKALPRPEQELDETRYIAARNVTEEILSAIWSEVLGVERVGVKDDFFELGGHSLLATQLVSRMRKVFSVELPLQALFDQPTVAALAEWIEQEKQIGTQDGMSVIKRADRGQPLPLSFAQQRLWFIDQLEPGSATYNVPMAIRMSGALNKDALQWAVQEIVRRHEVLRTRFPQRDGVGVQEIEAEMEVKVEEIDFGNLEEGSEREEAAAKHATGEAQRAFDLAQGGLVRVKLMRLAEQDHLLLVAMHHIVSDGWSMGIMMREFSQLYEARRNGEECLLPELPIQYADFSIWQRDWLQGAVLEEQLQYWRERLAGVQALELPTDRPRPAVIGSAGGTVGFHLESEQVARLKKFSQRQGTTLFMALLAAEKALLHRYSGQEDITVGSPIAGRRRKETEGLIGFFVNTLVLRTAVSGEMSFTGLLQQVRENMLEAYTHQDVPFEKVVEELKPERDWSRTPLFQMMFTLHNTPHSEMQLAGITVRLFIVDSQMTDFDLSWDLIEDGERLRGSVTYNHDLFDRTTAERMIGHYRVLLNGIVERPEQPVAELPLLVEGEREQLLVEWNRTAAEYPEKCVHDLFQEQVARTPGALAVECKGQAMTYEELDQRANQLAHYLQKQDIRPEVRVGICLERGLEMVVSMLAVLKAGGAYVPLDPAYPEERLKFIVDDAQAAVLLSQRRLEQRFSPGQAGLVFLEDVREEVEQCSGQAVESGVGPENLAYVIYTSGSTGWPKGVAVTHQSANVLLHWSREAFTHAELEGVLGSTSVCFDVSVFELYAPLSWGGTLLVVDNALNLPDWTGKERVKLACMVPSAMMELLRINGVPSSLRTVNLAGEALPWRLVKQIYEQTGVERVLNIYGPSEDTTYSTYAWVKRGEEARVPIGRPIANTQAYVLDLKGRFEVVGNGMVGELYLGGAGLARGYLDRPELTAERFVPNPFGRIGGERLYRTGDRVRWGWNAQLEFLGRLDYQVKIRGFRIELGEIEAALLRQEKVREAVVIAQALKAEEKRLVAYVALEQEEVDDSKSIESLKAGLAKVLPAYMVPSAFVLLEKMPLLPSGKIDRKALPAYEIDLLLHPASLGPRDTLELQLVHLWEELLAVQPIGVRDNFFELGGHSLKAVQLAARIRQQFDHSVPLALFLQNATIEGLAAAMRERVRETTPPALVRIKADGKHAPFFCVHPVGGNVLCYAGLVRLLSPEQPFYALQSPVEERLATIEMMASHYLACMRAVQPQGPYSIGGWSMGGVIAFEMARQLHSLGESAEVFLIDSLAPGLIIQRGKPDDHALWGHFISDLESLTGGKLAISWEAVQGLDAEQAVSLVLDHLREQQMVPAEFSNEELLALFQIFSNNLKALLSYQPVSHAGPVTLITSSASVREHHDSALGWRDLAAGPLEVLEIEGDHYSIVAGMHVNRLAALLEEKLPHRERLAVAAL